MQDWKGYFKGKRVTVMGLGLLGRGVGDTVFLASQGAELIVTDLKSSKELAPSIQKLKKYKNISYVLGKHELADFRDRDFILKAAGVPLDSPFVAEARTYGVPIEMSASLFTRFIPEGVITIGVTGTRGKSTVAHLLYHLLKKAGKRVYLAGNVRGISTLALLPKIKKGDIVVLELDSWQLQGFGEAKISPHIAVFTNFLSDHMNYYRGDERAYFADKENIFKFQEPRDYLFTSSLVAKQIRQLKGAVRIVSSLPSRYKLIIFGEHNRRNAAFVVAVARILDIPERTIQSALKTFTGVPGRLELLRTIRGIQIYNDTTATTPDATIAALRAIGKRKNILLIAGGADKKLDMTPLLKEIPKYCKGVFLLKGSGTAKIQPLLQVSAQEYSDLKSALKAALGSAKRGDIILFSPAFASFGMFQNEFNRGEQFVRLAKRLI